MARKVSRSFHPGIFGSLACLLLTSLFVAMGLLQTQRALEKSDIELQHQTTSIVAFDQDLTSKHRFARIDVSGHYDTERHILLDNKIWLGRGGVHVFTPFHTLDGSTILVNRGWLPLPADRNSLPAIPTPEHETVLRGILNIFPVPGRMLGAADKIQSDRWPQLVTYMNHDDIAASLKQPLENWVVQLPKTEQAGFEDREWKAVFLTADRHQAYAFQWFALAVASVFLWVFMGYRKPGSTQA